MSGAADRARDKAARLSVTARPVVLSDDEVATVPARPAARSQRSATVKTTLHLAPELHQQYTAWCLQAARQLQRSRVNASEVQRILVRRLLADDQLQADVIKALREERVGLAVSP